LSGKADPRQQWAQSFGSDPERYDRARPRYPDAMVERIVDSSPGHYVLDVGCGTGIAARQFRAAGCRVLGVEPDARMADLARRSGVEVEVATFEAWDPAGREFDATVAGQAWRSRERQKRRRCCVLEAGWQRSGMRGSLRPSWREPSLQSTGG
jgi:SAM-dependent methyltransferase